MQYHIEKGIPVSRDEAIDKCTDERKTTKVYSYYYHTILDNCVLGENGNIKCDSIIDSVWFKIVNKSFARDYVERCDPVFLKKHADISKHNCSGDDPFRYLRLSIGEKSTETIKMNGRKPLAPKGYKSSKEECVTQDDTIDVVLDWLYIIVSTLIHWAIVFAVVYFSE